jgi:hypothetical protein
MDNYPIFTFQVISFVFIINDGILNVTSIERNICQLIKFQEMNSELKKLSTQLLQDWCNTLLKYQIIGMNSPGLKGGLLSPAYARVEGRCAETVYPFLYLADKNKDSRFLDASIQLIDWAENNVIFPDGSWVNEVSISDWRGITVNAVIALAEALLRHGHLLEKKEYDRWIRIVSHSAEWVFKTIDLGYGNINYPVVSTYTLAIAGQLLDEKKYLKRADELAGKVLSYFTLKNHLLFGEGKPYDLKSPKGCYALDLAYNVEESLPALALYGILAKNEELLGVLTESLKSHLEFMLPDGAWDNSWGTRNYKWTYWGSRNSDGCQPAYALLADRDPRFYKAALRSTQLQEKCTHNGLLYGGPHNTIHGELPSVHHTFCHAKALATILDYGIPEHSGNEQFKLPREEEKGILEFSDIQTWLVSKGGFRATITGYDREYEANTHATGGAISLLWHSLTGPLLAASISEYRLIEASNMQMDKDPFSMPLTPRLEIQQNNRFFRSSSDLSAKIKVVKSSEMVEFLVDAHLVDGAQNSPENGEFPVQFHYLFDHNLMTIAAFGSNRETRGQLNFYLPVISANTEKYYFIGDKQLCIEKGDIKLMISSSDILSIDPTNGGRVFNFVPGFEALPIKIKCEDQSVNLFKLTLEVIPNKA